MKKLIGKTVFVTVALLLAAICLLYICMTFFAPETLASFWDGMGSYSLSVKYYERQYKKTGETEDLSVLVIKLNEKTESGKSADYLAEMVNKEDFASYCEQQDKSGSYLVNAVDFYYGKYVVACFYAGGIEKAIDIAAQGVKYGYSETSPFYILMVDADGLTAEDGAKIAAKISAIKAELGESETVNADSDLECAALIGK